MQGICQRLGDARPLDILRGEFKDGDQLIQEALAREYDVSRMPVREALRQLEARGLARLELHRGAIVSSIPVEQIGELFHLRAASLLNVKISCFTSNLS
ncbi:GntR family transcriptional regulator [Sphingosinicella rhizophila]|uniref:GntR family transcriptional regulator n=1 Tax=Sphingosinicella rhizophila TaxID=3050082 RepID=UPI0039656932